MAVAGMQWRWILGLGLAVLTGAAPSVAETLVIKGSDTLGGQLVPRLAEAFQREHPEVRFEIASEGSSTGIVAVLEGGADLAMSSRPISERDRAMARRLGKELRAITIALDAIVVIVHPENERRNFALREVEQLFCGDLRNWVSVSGRAGPVYLYTRHTASGTYSRFQELAMRKRDYSSHAQKMAGNEQIAMEVARNPLGIGYVSRQQAGARGVAVCRLDGIEPTVGALVSERYPLLRQLWLVQEAGMGTPMEEAFVAFSRSEVARQIILSSGFVPYENEEAGR